VKRDTDQLFSNHVFSTELIVTAKEVSDIPFQAKVYPVVATRFSYVWRPGIKWGFETSMDLTYNMANQNFFPTENHTFFQAVQLGIYGGAVAYFHKSAIVLGGGWYLYDEINVAGRFYNRMGFQQHFTDRLYATAAIKANFAKADYFEFGMGYRFIKSKNE
jgi:hypothetical protein